MSQSSVLTAPLLKAIRKQYRLGWEGIHGTSHWARVHAIGRRLAPPARARHDHVEVVAA